MTTIMAPQLAANEFGVLASPVSEHGNGAVPLSATPPSPPDAATSHVSRVFTKTPKRQLSQTTSQPQQPHQQQQQQPHQQQQQQPQQQQQQPQQQQQQPQQQQLEEGERQLEEGERQVLGTGEDRVLRITVLPAANQGYGLGVRAHSTAPGVVSVSKCDPAGQAYAAGVRDGDVLLEINGHDCRSVTRGVCPHQLPAPAVTWHLLCALPGPHAS